MLAAMSEIEDLRKEVAALHEQTRDIAIQVAALHLLLPHALTGVVPTDDRITGLVASLRPSVPAAICDALKAEIWKILDDTRSLRSSGSRSRRRLS